MSELPAPYRRFTQQFPQIAEAYTNLGKAAHGQGPLDPTTRQLIKLGMAIATGREGAVHAHTRRALEMGISSDQIYHCLVLAITTIGFPATVAAYTWINDVLDAQ